MEFFVFGPNYNFSTEGVFNLLEQIYIPTPPPSTNFIITESGNNIITEDGNLMITE